MQLDFFSSIIISLELEKSANKLCFGKKYASTLHQGAKSLFCIHYQWPLTSLTDD